MALSVTKYAGPCGVCEHNQYRSIDRMIRENKPMHVILMTFPGLVRRDLYQHVTQCILPELEAKREKEATA